MAEDILLVKLERRRWIIDSPLNDVVDGFVEYLRRQRYSSFTIQGYLKAVAHFGRWITMKGFAIENIDEDLIDYFVKFHLPHCKCPAPRIRDGKYVRAGLRHLRTVLKQQGLVEIDHPATPTEKELERFQLFLLNVQGLAPNTCKCRLAIVSKFLSRTFEERELDLQALRIEDIDTFFMHYAVRWKASSMAVIRSSLRSYFKFRMVQGDSTEALIAALPNIAPYWNRGALPTFLTSEELNSFLQAFDQSYPTGLRDYAIARCMIDLGLRGHEVAHLCFESFDWREGTITISRSKSRRTYRLPLPPQTGKAIVQYLTKGRPSSSSRVVFARHVAPYDKPLTKGAISTAMTLAFIRCGLFRITGTHVLRRTLAVRLQQSGVSLKEIADVLRHKDLSTTQVYTRVDIEALRSVALPWPWRKS